MITKFKLFENKMWYKTIPEILNYLSELNDKTWVFIDTETTGLGGPKDEEVPVSSWTRKKTLNFNHYYDEIKGKDYLDEQEVLRDFFFWVSELKNVIFVIQNAEFDMQMLSGRFKEKIKVYEVLDTKMFLQLYIIPIYQTLAETDDVYKKKLDNIGTSSRDNGLISSSMGKWAPEFDIDTSKYHDALFDCEMTIKMFSDMIEVMKDNINLDISKYQNERIKTYRI